MNEIIKSALTVLFHHKLIEEAEALEKIADTCRCDNCQAYRASFAKEKGRNADIISGMKLMEKLFVDWMMQMDFQKVKAGHAAQKMDEIIREVEGKPATRCPLCGQTGSGPCSACGWTGEIKYGESCL
jgi:ABC-type protease/lipase transport system fused ATPase/permease subunit